VTTTRSAHRRSTRTPWPLSAGGRTLTRLAFALVYVALIVSRVLPSGRTTANRELVDRAGLIKWGSSHLAFLSRAYPPLPTAIASVAGTTFVLALVGALGAGIVLESIAFRLAMRGFPLWAVLLLTAAVGANPAFARIVSGDLTLFLTIGFLVLALDGFMRFAYRGHTHGGFQAGLSVGMATLCNPTAALCAVGFAAAAPLIARHRFATERAAGRATAGVLLFPTVAGIAGWIFLCWRFAGAPIQWLRNVAPSLGFPGGAGVSAESAIDHVTRAAAATPLFLLALIFLVAARNTAAAVGSCLPMLCVALALWLGLPFTTGATAVVLTIVGLFTLPGRPSRLVVAAGCIFAVAGVALTASAILLGA